MSALPGLEHCSNVGSPVLGPVLATSQDISHLVWGHLGWLDMLGHFSGILYMDLGLLGLDLSILGICQTQTSRGAKENVHRPKLQKRYYNSSAKEIVHFMGKPNQSFGLVSSNVF